MEYQIQYRLNTYYYYHNTYVFCGIQSCENQRKALCYPLLVFLDILFLKQNLFSLFSKMFNCDAALLLVHTDARQQCYWLTHNVALLLVLTFLFIFQWSRHRRRIKTEEKAKVVASVWGKEFIEFFAALAVLPWTILNNRMNCTRMIMKEKDEFIVLGRSDDICLFFCICPFSMWEKLWPAAVVFLQLALHLLRLIKYSQAKASPCMFDNKNKNTYEDSLWCCLQYCTVYMLQESPPGRAPRFKKKNKFFLC